jgi:hypothetical protein
VGKTANSLLKDGAKIDLKNRRLHKSTQTRAPTIEILPVLSPNKVMGVTKSVSLRDKLSWPSGRKSQTLKQATWNSVSQSGEEQLTYPNLRLATGKHGHETHETQGGKNHDEMYGQKPT